MAAGACVGMALGAGTGMMVTAGCSSTPTPVDYARSNFAYAGPFTETILLGNIALRVGQRLEWDGANMRFPNLPEADRYVSKEYREAWDFGPTS